MTPKKGKGKGNESQSNNNLNNGKVDGKKERHMHQQDKWKIESPKDGKAKNYNTKNTT